MAGGDNLRVETPPKFVPHEVVRVVAVTGRERDLPDEPFDAATVVGQEVIVQGATPYRGGWVISVWVESLGDLYEFPEAALAATGRILDLDHDGASATRPLDPGRDRWRDDVLFHVTTNATDEAEASAIAERAAATLTGIEGVDEVDWRLDPPSDDPYTISLWAWSDGDALAVFGRVVGLVGWEWDHDDDEEQFISSKWRRLGKHAFLAPGIEQAEVVYRRWLSPARRSRREIPSPS